MNREISLLDQVRIASPCPMSWRDMEGDEQVRSCHQCKLNVYDLSALSKGEAEDLIGRKEGRLCVTYFQRADGTVITSNCPVGLRLARRAAIKIAGKVAAVLAFLMTATALLGSDSRRGRTTRLCEVQPFKAISTWLSPARRPVVMGQLMMPVRRMGRVRMNQGNRTTVALSVGGE